MTDINNISDTLNKIKLCKLKLGARKKVPKPSKDGLTFPGTSGILTKLFGR